MLLKSWSISHLSSLFFFFCFCFVFFCFGFEGVLRSMTAFLVYSCWFHSKFWCYTHWFIFNKEPPPFLILHMKWIWFFHIILYKISGTMILTLWGTVYCYFPANHDLTFIKIINYLYFRYSEGYLNPRSPRNWCWDQSLLHNGNKPDSSSVKCLKIKRMNKNKWKFCCQNQESSPLQTELMTNTHF